MGANKLFLVVLASLNLLAPIPPYIKMEKYLTLDNLAQIFNASLTTLRKRIKEGVLIPYQKTDKGYLFDPKEIKKLNKTDIVRKFKLPSVDGIFPVKLFR